MKRKTQRKIRNLNRALCIYLALFSAANLSGAATKVKEKIYENKYSYEYDLYEKSINEIASLFKELDLQNPTQCYIMFHSLLFNEYFSKDNEFNLEKDEENLQNIYGCLGYDVLTGNAGYKNISDMLNDVLNKCGYESYCTTTYIDDRKNKNKKEFVNHQIVIVKHDNIVTYYDPTNLSILDKYKNTFYSINTINEKNIQNIRPFTSSLISTNFTPNSGLDALKIKYYTLSDNDYLSEDYIVNQYNIVQEINHNNLDKIFKFKDDFKNNITAKIIVKNS